MFRLNRLFGFLFIALFLVLLTLAIFATVYASPVTSPLLRLSQIVAVDHAALLCAGEENAQACFASNFNGICNYVWETDPEQATLCRGDDPRSGGFEDEPTPEATVDVDNAY